MSSPTNTGFFGHPKGLRTLFFTEMWERFSYYGMRALLTLFMTAATINGGLGYGVDKAGAIYAIYTSMVYLASVPGGWLADNFLGQRRSVFYGGVVIMVGHILLAIHGDGYFFGGLAAVVIGTGLLKPNISVIVGQLYSPEDARRDAGFSIFYMGINIGAFAAPIVCGWLAQDDSFKEMLTGWGMDPTHSWHWGFAAAAVGMFFGLMQYLLTSRHLGEAGLNPIALEPADQARNKRTLSIGAGAFLVLVAFLAIYESSATQYKSLDYRTEGEGLVLVSKGTDGDTAAAHSFADGKPVALGDVESNIGQDTMKVLRERYLDDYFASGTATGKLDDIYLRVPESAVTWTEAEPSDEERDGEFVRMGTVEYEVADGAIALTGQLVINENVKGSLGTFTRAQLDLDVFKENLGPLRDPLAKALLGNAIDSGRANGELTDEDLAIDIKVGGLTTNGLKNGFGIFLLLMVILIFAKLFSAGNWTKSQRARLVTIFVLFCGAAVFWGLFEQAGSTLTLFAERNTKNSLFGWRFPSSWWQSANAILIILLAPFFAWLWTRLGDKNPSYPFKFAIGLAFAGLGFLVLIGGATLARGGVLVSPMWLLLVYLLHTIGELCLSPVGLSSMTKLAPARVVSLMMGVWFLAASVGNFIAGNVATFYEDFELPTLFSIVGSTGLVMALIMLALVIPMKRMMKRSEEPVTDRGPEG